MGRVEGREDGKRGRGEKRVREEGREGRREGTQEGRGEGRRGRKRDGWKKCHGAAWKKESIERTNERKIEGTAVSADFEHWSLDFFQFFFCYITSTER